MSRRQERFKFAVFHRNEQKLRLVLWAYRDIIKSYKWVKKLRTNDKAIKDKDSNSYKAIMDSAYGAPKQETDVNNNVTLTNFNIKDVLNFDNPQPEV